MITSAPAMRAAGALRAAAMRVRAPVRPAARLLSTSAPLRAEADAESPYPFASNVVVRSQAERPADSVRAPPPPVKHRARGVMPRVDSQLTAERDPNEEIARLFSRRSPECVPAGSILLVESWLNPGHTSFSSFSGVLISVKRAGVATSFVLRNIAHKLGVEVRFQAYSPAIKQIRVIQRADARKGERSSGLLRTRRAKLYYMRRRADRRVNAVAGIVKQHKAVEMQREAAATKSSKKKGKK